MYNIILSDNDLASRVAHSMRTKRPVKYKGKLPLLSHGDPVPYRLRGSVAERMGLAPQITEEEPPLLAANIEANIFSEIVAGLRPGKIMSHGGIKTAVIYEGENGPSYIELNGNTHNIITNGKWTYPALVNIIPYIKTDGKPSTNIIICKKSIAKNLVYFKLHKFRDAFDSDILGRSKFHLLDHHNAYSYANATMGKFSRENEILGDNVYVDRNESSASYENLRIKFRTSKNPSIAVSVKKSVVREGKLFCWLAYSFINLQEAKSLVYWSKNAVNMVNSKKTIHRGAMTGRSSSHTTGWTYGGRTLKSTNNSIFVTSERPSAEIEVERVDNRAIPELPQPDVDRHYVNTQAETRIVADENIDISPIREHGERIGRITRAEEVGREGLPWHENPNITTRDTRRDGLREEIRAREEVRVRVDNGVEIERHDAPQWDALVNQAQERLLKKPKRLFRTKRNTMEEEQHDREKRITRASKHTAPQWGGLTNDEIGRRGAEVHVAGEWGTVSNAAREVDLTAYGPTTIKWTDLPEKRNEEDEVEENDEGVDEGAEEEHLEEHLARALGRTRAAPAPNIEEDQNVEEVQVQGGHFEVRALGIAKVAPAPNVAEDQDVEDVQDG